MNADFFIQLINLILIVGSGVAVLIFMFYEKYAQALLYAGTWAVSSALLIFNSMFIIVDSIAIGGIVMLTMVGARLTFATLPSTGRH